MQVCEPSRLDQNKTPNHEEIGKGYNMLLSEPFKHGKRDPGFRPQMAIYHPYAFNDDCKCVEAGGYNFARNLECDYTSTTVLFENSNEIKNKLKETINNKDVKKSLEIQVSEGQQAQFTNAKTFGEQVSLHSKSGESSSSNNCIDKKRADSTKIGQTVEASRESTHKIDTSIDAKINVKVPLAAELETNVHTGFETTNTKGATKGKSKEKTKENSITTKICGVKSKDKGTSSGNTTNTGAADTNTKGSHRTILTKIPGFLDAIENSKTIIQNNKLFTETSGKFGMTEKLCTVYTAKLHKGNPPPFTTNFVLELRKVTKFVKKK